MKQVKFEKTNRNVTRVKDTISYIARTAQTKQDAVNRLSDILPDSMKIGYGGSHVWCSNSSNERIFIITGY